MAELYDQIGVGYRARRRPDPRLAAAITRALGETETVVNVGAGAGSYEPADRSVVAVEPAMTMIRQRSAGSAPVVQASATELPFRDDGFAAALAVLTVHHWPDRARGLDELGRIARRRVVVVTWDPVDFSFWLVDDYFPELAAIDRQICPAIEEFRRALGHIEVYPLPIPHDCVDGFRSAISTFAKMTPSDVEAGLERLRRDLEDGTWARRYGDLLDRAEIDLGYRIVVAAKR